ncbi:MAG: ankyrin repeat domain-containing protein [Methyloprofundus sp.]|nr:ankyrin repeat domain-containing protein [Methyloprofundus sp.]
MSLLSLSSMQGHFEAVRMLIESGADVHSIDMDKWTALHRVCSDTYVDVDPDLVEEDMNNRIKITQLLLDSGININSKGSDGSTALHLASAEGLTRLAEVLISNGANLNLKDRDVFYMKTDELEKAKYSLAKDIFEAWEFPQGLHIVDTVWSSDSSGVFAIAYYEDHEADIEETASGRISFRTDFHDSHIELSSLYMDTGNEAGYCNIEALDRCEQSYRDFISSIEIEDIKDYRSSLSESLDFNLAQRLI